MERLLFVAAVYGDTPVKPPSAISVREPYCPSWRLSFPPAALRRTQVDVEVACSAAELFMRSPSTARSNATQQFARIADGLAIAVAVSLPWSSSASSILTLLLLLALVPALRVSDVVREVATPAGGLPVALFALAALGMAWTGVGWAERLGG